MNERIVELINREIDGLLTSDEQRELQSVLASDSEARVFYESHTYAAGLLKKITVANPPAHLKKNVMASVRNHAASATSQPRGRRFVTFLAGLFQPSGAIPMAVGMAAGIFLTVIFWGDGTIPSYDNSGMTGTLVNWSAAQKGRGSAPIEFAIGSGKVGIRYTLSENSATIFINAAVSNDAAIDIRATSAAFSVLSIAQQAPGESVIDAAPGSIRITHAGTNDYAISLARAEFHDMPIEIVVTSDGASVTHPLTIEWR
jgi:hypothetical protein